MVTVDRYSQARDMVISGLVKQGTVKPHEVDLFRGASLSLQPRVSGDSLVLTRGSINCYLNGEEASRTLEEIHAKYPDVYSQLMEK